MRTPSVIPPAKDSRGGSSSRRINAHHFGAGRTTSRAVLRLHDSPATPADQAEQGHRHARQWPFPSPLRQSSTALSFCVPDGAWEAWWYPP